MSLRDLWNDRDFRTQALLTLGGTMMGAAGPSRVPISTGQALSAGLGNLQQMMRQYTNQKMQSELFDIEKRRMEQEEMDRANEAQHRMGLRRDLLGAPPGPGGEQYPGSVQDPTARAMVDAATSPGAPPGSLLDAYKILYGGSAPKPPPIKDIYNADGTVTQKQWNPQTQAYDIEVGKGPRWNPTAGAGGGADTKTADANFFGRRAIEFFGGVVHPISGGLMSPLDPDKQKNVNRLSARANQIYQANKAKGMDQNTAFMQAVREEQAQQDQNNPDPLGIL